MIPAHSDIGSRIFDSTSLTDQNVSGLDSLITEFLDAESFALRLTAVLGTTYTFFMCLRRFFLNTRTLSALQVSSMTVAFTTAPST